MNISEWNQQQTTIGHLKVSSTGSREDISKTVLRLRVERLLSNADLHPPGLGTGAVLIVHKLDTLAPVEVSTPSQIETNSFTPAMHAPRELKGSPVQAGWHELLRSQVAALYAAAVRPAFEPVPLDATSVLFADPGEMLSCLTRDLLSGQAHERWYWQQVLRNASRTPGTALPALWCEQATFVPTVLASLRPAEMFSVITHLTPLAVKQIIQSLHRSFDLPPGVFTDIASSESGGTTSTRVVTGDLSAVKEPVVPSPPATSPPPWEQWLPDASLPALSPEARYLLGLGLALYHAPAFARSARFASQAAHWLQTVHERQIYGSERSRHVEKKVGKGITHPGQNDAQIVPSVGEGEQRRRQVEDSSRRDGENRQAMLPVGEEQLPVVSARSDDETPRAAKPEPSSSSIEPGERSDERVSAQSHGPAIPAEQELVQQESRGLEASVPTELETGVSTGLPESFREVQPPGSQAPMHPAVSAAPYETKTREFEFGGSKTLSTDGVPTRLGGVLYLINLLTWLNLPHSWNNDGTLAEHMSGWAIIEALARGLLGDLHEQYIHDPIWHALAVLDGRQPGAPIATGGMVMGQDKSFRLPASWLRRYGSATWSALQEEERLLLYDDSARFLIVDAPLRDRSFFEATHAEVKAYCDQGLEISWHLGFPEAFKKFRHGSNEHDRNCHPERSEGSLCHLTPIHLYDIDHPSCQALVPSFEPCLNKLSGMSHPGDEDVLCWLERVLGFVSNLLARALGESLDEPARLAELLLCRHGQLIVSRTHVDLHMSMEEISIAVRRAGLDRDPGWVPDLGRIVYFHFD